MADFPESQTAVEILTKLQSQLAKFNLTQKKNYWNYN